MPSPGASDQIDLVDVSDNVVGRMTRGEALESHGGFRVVHVMVFNRKGELLLQHLVDGHSRSPGRWGSSTAGYLHAGEAPMDGAVRRLREELGLTKRINFCGRTLMNDEGTHKFIYVYRATADKATNRDSDQVASLRFWHMDKVTRLLREDPDVFTKTFPYALAALGDTGGTGDHDQ